MEVPFEVVLKKMISRLLGFAGTEAQSLSTMLVQTQGNSRDSLIHLDSTVAHEKIEIGSVELSVANIVYTNEHSVHLKSST